MPDTYNAATSGVSPNISQGITLYISATAPSSASYYPLQNIQKLDVFSVKASTIDTTNISSTVASQIKGIPHYEAISGEFDSAYDSNVTPLITNNLAAYGSSAVLYFNIKVPCLNVQKMYTFPGFFTDYKPVSGSEDNKMSGSFTIQPTGAVTEAAYA